MNLATQNSPQHSQQIGAASHCDSCTVRNRAICAALESTVRDQLSREGRIQVVPRGRTLVWEGEDALLVANVIDGVLKLSTSTSDGREQIVGVVYPSDFIGRPFGSTAAHGVTALTEARVCVFNRRDFDAFARDHPGLEHKLLERTLGELDRTRRWMLLLGRKSASEKVASFLLEMSERLTNATCKTVGDLVTTSFTLPFSRQQIADVLGLTIETVSRQLTRLERDGVIRKSGTRGIELLDPAHLSMLSGREGV